jgi:hypothetical protein
MTNTQHNARPLPCCEAAQCKHNPGGPLPLNEWTNDALETEAVRLQWAAEVWTAEDLHRLEIIAAELVRRNMNPRPNR